jgi:hypothetical protein
MKHLRLFVVPAALLILLAAGIFPTSVMHAASASPSPATKCGQWTIVNSPSVGSTSTLTAVAAVSTNDVWAVGSAGNNTLIESYC